MSTQITHPGELSLAKLLTTLTAILHPTTYVFAVIPDETKLPPFTEVEMLFREAKTEGITVITSRDYAESHGIEYGLPCRKITLDVTSSLDAVGFIGVVATRLAAAGMGVRHESAAQVGGSKIEGSSMSKNGVSGVRCGLGQLARSAGEFSRLPPAFTPSNTGLATLSCQN